MSIEKRLDRIEEWTTRHEKSDDEQFQDIRDTLKEQQVFHKQMNEKLDLLLKEPTPEEKAREEAEFDEKIENAMKKVIYGGSKWTYRAILVIATIFGALIVIGGGFKWLLALLGFSRN